MSSKDLIIVFVKNLQLGKVKTRLAKYIGNEGAFQVYKELLEIAENEVLRISEADIQIYYSDTIDDSMWGGFDKLTQQGNDLGERMMKAFINGFESGYERIILIGSDIPDMNAGIMIEALDVLHEKDTVFGPAEDGGYYLLGMTKLYDCIFHNKAWSTDQVLEQTLTELCESGISYGVLTELNDIDTIEDLMNSSLSEKFDKYYELLKCNK